MDTLGGGGRTRVASRPFSLVDLERVLNNNDDSGAADALLPSWSAPDDMVQPVHLIPEPLQSGQPMWCSGLSWASLKRMAGDARVHVDCWPRNSCIPKRLDTTVAELVDTVVDGMPFGLAETHCGAGAATLHMAGGFNIVHTAAVERCIRPGHFGVFADYWATSSEVLSAGCVVEIRDTVVVGA